MISRRSFLWIAVGLCVLCGSWGYPLGDLDTQIEAKFNDLLSDGALTREKKSYSSPTTVCVEINPQSPYERSYMMCKDKRNYQFDQPRPHYHSYLGGSHHSPGNFHHPATSGSMKSKGYVSPHNMKDDRENNKNHVPHGLPVQPLHLQDNPHRSLHNGQGNHGGHAQNHGHYDQYEGGSHGDGGYAHHYFVPNKHSYGGHGTHEGYGGHGGHGGHGNYGGHGGHAGYGGYGDHGGHGGHYEDLHENHYSHQGHHHGGHGYSHGHSHGPHDVYSFYKHYTDSYDNHDAPKYTYVHVRPQGPQHQEHDHHYHAPAPVDYASAYDAPGPAYHTPEAHYQTPAPVYYEPYPAPPAPYHGCSAAPNYNYGYAPPPPNYHHGSGASCGQKYLFSCTPNVSPVGCDQDKKSSGSLQASNPNSDDKNSDNKSHSSSVIVQPSHLSGDHPSTTPSAPVVGAPQDEKAPQDKDQPKSPSPGKKHETMAKLIDMMNNAPQQNKAGQSSRSTDKLPTQFRGAYIARGSTKPTKP